MRSGLDKGGARPTLFTIQLTLPTAIDNGRAARKLLVTAESTQLPASEIGVIPVPYFGRQVKYAGDRQYGPWTVQIVNDEDFLTRDAFEAWHSMINTRLSNYRDTPTASANFYKTTAEITQYGRVKDVIRTYQMNGLWPSEVSPIDLSWGAQDQIERFSVTFQYDWFEVNGPTGQGGNTL